MIPYRPTSHNNKLSVTESTWLCLIFSSILHVFRLIFFCHSFAPSERWWSTVHSSDSNIIIIAVHDAHNGAVCNGHDWQYWKTQLPALCVPLMTIPIETVQIAYVTHNDTLLIDFCPKKKNKSKQCLSLCKRQSGRTSHLCFFLLRCNIRFCGNVKRHVITTHNVRCVRARVQMLRKKKTNQNKTKQRNVTKCSWTRSTVTKISAHKTAHTRNAMSDLWLTRTKWKQSRRLAHGHHDSLQSCGW